MSDFLRPASRDDYEIAVICALQIESNAVEALFDENWENEETYDKARNDTNAYSMGRIGKHNVVLAYMPGIGKKESAQVTSHLLQSFSNIRLGLVVGICGGVPSGLDVRNEILLGDIVISTGLVQYDLGRQYPDRFETKDTLRDSLGRPNPEIRSFLEKMQALFPLKRLETKTSAHLARLLKQEDFKLSSYPGADQDILYEPTYRHKHQDSRACLTCAECKNKGDEVCHMAPLLSCADLGCSIENQIPRNRLKAISETMDAVEMPKPLIHFGLVGSGDSVIKSGYRRDELASECHVIAFEMEGAGAWDTFPTVVIKAVSDYSDTHKSYQWQRYAAACAAACMKAFLEEWRGIDKAPQPGAGSRPSAYIVQQASRSRGSVREEPEPRLQPESRSRIDEQVEEAHSLLLRRADKESMKKDREVAQVILKKVLAGSTDPGAFLLRQIYWGLMVAAKELSCYGKRDEEKFKHIEDAEIFAAELSKVVLQSSNASIRIQVRLEQCIIMGRKAMLRFRKGDNMDGARRPKSEAIDGIDKELQALQVVDRVKWEEIVDATMEWRNRFSEAPF